MVNKKNKAQVLKAPKPEKPDWVLAKNPARAPWARPWGDPVRQDEWVLWIPDDAPRQKGNSKHIVIPGGPRSGRPPILVGSKTEQRHEKALRAAVKALVLGSDRLAVTCLPEDGIGVTLDVLVDLPLPELSADHGPAWRDRALSGAPELAPGAQDDGTPDRGNLGKMIEDACKGVFGFKDDRQVQGGWVGKRWSMSPGWHLRVTRARSGTPT